MLKFIRKHRSTICVAALAAISFCLQAWYRASNEGWLFALSIVAVVLAALVVPIFKHFDDKADKRELDAYKEQVADALEPLLQQLVKVSEAEPGHRKHTQLSGLVRVAIESARHVAGQRRLRATYYRIRPADARKNERFSPEGHTGRGTKPKTVFSRGTANGNFVFKKMEDNEPIFVGDVDKCDLPGWKARSRDYKTFISVPVRGESRVYGMLTVDAPTVGELTEYDESFIKCVGLLLASGIAMVNPN